MSEMATFLENELIDHCFRNAAYTAPTTVYVALFTSAASGSELEAGTLTNEVSTSGTAYARQSVAFSAPSDGATSNSSDITFPQATAAWGTIRYMAIMDNDTEGGGNVMMYTQLDADKVVDSGDTLKFLAGDIDLTFA